MKPATVYVLGNPHLTNDRTPLLIKNALEEEFPEIRFEYFDPTEETDIGKNPVFIDTIAGVKKLKVITSLKNMTVSPRNSLHDYDLPLFLGLSMKLSKIKSFKIIGIPQDMPLNKSIREASRAIKNI